MNLERLCMPIELVRRRWMAQPFLIRTDEGGKPTIWRATMQGHFLMAEQVPYDTPGETVDPKKASIIAGWLKHPQNDAVVMDVKRFTQYCGLPDYPVVCPACHGQGGIEGKFVYNDECNICGGKGELSSHGGGIRVIRLGKICGVMFNCEYMARLLDVADGGSFRILLRDPLSSIYLFGETWTAMLMPIARSDKEVVPYII